MAKTTKAKFAKTLAGKAKGLFGQKAEGFTDEFAPPDLPEGDYTVRLSSATAGEDNSGNPWVRFTYVVDEGEYEGKQLHDRHNLSERGKRTMDNALDALFRTLTRLGVQVTGLKSEEQLWEVLQKLTKTKPRFGISFEPDDYSGRIRIQSRLGKDGQPEEGTPADYSEEFQEEAEGEEGEGEEDSAWKVGDEVRVVDPDDPDGPWEGVVQDFSGETEAEVLNPETEDVWIVQTEHLEER
jgi:hypothetical protein